MCWIKASVGGGSTSLRCFSRQNITYLSSSAVPPVASMWEKGRKLKLPLRLLFSHLPHDVDPQAARHPDGQHCAWVHSNLSFFQFQSRNCFESHPVRAWNPKSVLHICSPSSWDTLCTGTNRNRSITPVWNRNSSHERLWNCTLHITITASVIRFSFH